MHGMNKEQSDIVSKLKALKTQQFTIGIACDHTGVTPKECETLFPQLCKLGVLRCPVNDGGMMLYQLALDVVLEKTQQV